MSVESLFDGDGPEVFQAALESDGLPVSNVTTDIYGTSRHPTTPDIGAVEFTLPAHDVGAKLLVAPQTYCGIGNMEAVTIRIQNYGANSETGFNVAFKFNGNEWVTENVGALLVQPGGTVDFTFSTTLNLSQVGMYSFSLTSSLPEDLNSTNDTIMNLDVIHIPALVEGVGNMIPIHNAIDLDKTVSLSWSPAPSATKYDVYVWKAGDPEPATPQIANLTQINKNYSSLDYGQTYYWKVVAKNSCNQMVIGATQAFTVRDLPDLKVNTVISPLTAFTGQPIEIEWIVNNIGSGGTQGVVWSDAIYLSSDATLNPGLDIYLGSVQNLTALEEGIAYTNDATFTLPNNTVGNYYIFVYTDRFSSVVESDNGNNWSRSAAVAMIELSPLPDLDAVEVVAPPLSFSGQNINVQYTIENDGTAATGLRTWHDRIWLTTDQNNPGEFILGTIPHTANLLPGNSYSKTLSFTIPNGLLGEYYVFVQSDFHDVIYEFAAESNNTLVSDTIQILLTPPADFVMTNIILTDTISSDYNNPLSWTVSNMGAGPSKINYWKDDIYISPAPVYNSNFNILFKQKYHSQLVPSMATYSKNESSDKMILPSGLYYIYGFTDAGNREYEYNMEGNNIYAYPTPVYVGNPDLLISQPEFPDTVGHMSPFTLTWNQINQGYGRYMQKSVRTKIYGSDSPVFNLQTAILIHENIASHQLMDPLDTLPKSIMISMPPQLSGEIYFHFHINPNGTVYEAAGDTNNIYSSPIPVYVSPPELPDLEVIDFTIPDTVYAGTSFVIQYATQNTGTDGIENTWEDDVYISFDPVWMPAHALKLADIIQQADLLPLDTIHTAIVLSLNPNTNENVYYIYVKSDEENNLYEGPGESNNIERSASFYVKGAPFVDLAIDTCTLENTTYFSGETYTIAWTTTVMSDQDPVIRSWKDHVFLSTDQTLDTLVDIPVGIFSPNTTGIAFDQGSPLVQEDEIEVPKALSGSYYLIFQLDYTLLHHDTLRTNNTRLLKDENGDPKLLSIQLSPSPDLMISTFVAPANAVVSLSFPLHVCISNEGNGVAQGPWENQVYLSTDMLINGGDVRLSLHNTPSNSPQPLLPDSTVCYTENVVIPQGLTGNYFLIARTDPLNKIYEHGGESNNTTIREIEVSQPLPSDLIVSEVTVPLEAIAGDVIEISWKTENTGSNPAYGAFREVVYLSPDSTWSVDDPVFGVKNTSGYFPPLSTSASTLTEKVSDVVEGNYHAIVRTDVQQQIAEDDDNNNDAASLDVMQVNVKTLIIDTLAIDSIPGSALLYYRVIVHPGQEGESLVISLQGDSIEGLNELYVKFGGIPTRGDFDYGPQQSFGAYQHVIIPALEVGTYYIAAYCATQNNEPQVTELLATILPFEILSSSPNIGVKDKQVTVEIRGIKLDQTDRFRLRRSDPWFEVIADPVYVRSDNRVYATFDLTGVPLDTFQLDGVKSNNDLAVSPEPFIVVESGEAELQITAFAPGIFNAQTSPAKIVINFINTGDVDVVGAIVEVEAPYGNLIAPTLDALRAGEGIPLLEVPLNEPNGPPGIIRPGGSGTIEVFVWSTPGPSFVVGLKE
ncbi:MAG: hypothetical protein KA166_01460 [Saprospiraceae bacterium]|nr:hypothetical protein [Saprospiraceae bacterium]